MTQASTARRMAQPIRILSTVAIAALLAGCQAIQGGDATRTQSPSSLANPQLVERDVEAPEIFSADDRGLWDGRPSLGGIWVAATDVTQPERVIIRNPANGKFVVGALFKNEHAGSGPGLMLSSDAAVAIGVPAGQPTSISVVALRTQEAVEPNLPEAPISAAVDPFADSDTATTTLDGPGVTGIAEDPAADIVDLTAETSGAIATAATTAATTAAEPAAEVAASNLDRIAAAVAEIDGPETPEAPLETAALDGPAIDDAGTGATPPGFEGAALPDPQLTLAAQVAQAVAATEAAEELARAEGRYVPVASGASPSVETASLDSVSDASEPASRPYIRIGTYSRESNAKDAAAKFEGTGITAEVKGGGSEWRVILGPVATVDEQSATLRKAREFGFDDAYPVGG